MTKNLSSFGLGKMLHLNSLTFFESIIPRPKTALYLPSLLFVYFISHWAWLVNWCFEITSGLKETFIKRYIVERANKAELRPHEQREKTDCRRENLWNEIQLKGP